MAEKAPGIKDRIFLVDDHRMVRCALAERLQDEPDLEVCGEADEWAEALKGISNSDPDLVILNLSFQNYDGFELIESIKTMDAGQKILVLSLFEADIYEKRATRAGAVGYVMKQEGPGKMLSAIRRALAGSQQVKKQKPRRKASPKKKWPNRPRGNRPARRNHR